MSDNSDESDSPRAISSSSDSNSNCEEEKEINSNQYADPESPSATQQSSDESVSSSSDGVLVDLPGNPDQDSRCLQGDHDSGILVNIDGSMQEHSEDRVEESGREETFVDAPDQLGVTEGRSVGLEESMAMIEIRESSGETSSGEELARVQARLDETIVECRKYKEEREVFGREVVSLRHQLEDMINRQSLLVGNNDQLVDHLRRLEKGEGEDKALTSPTPLHSMLGDCSRFLFHMKSILEEQGQSEGTIRELHAIIYTKDQEIEDLIAKVSESSVSRDVVVSYLGSLPDVWSESLKESSDVVSKRLLASLSSVIGQEYTSSEDSIDDGISLVEKSTLLLIEKQKQFLSEIEQLGQCLADVRSDFVISQENPLGYVFAVAREELLEFKRKESHFSEKMNRFEEENRKMVEQIDKMNRSLEEANAETSKTKMELSQAESKLVVAKEKLSIAVTKGKALVQHRDTLKQSIAEKTSELEKCLLELQQKSDALETAKASAEELNQSQNLIHSLQDSLAEKEKVLQEIEELVSQIESPEELLSMDIIDRIRWFVDQKHISEGIFLESRRVKDALSSIDLPETVSSTELVSQINWLVRSLYQAKGDISKLQDEIAGAQVVAASCESELSEARKEIDRLTASLLEEKQEKDSLQVEHEELSCKFDGIADKLSMISSEKDDLMRALVEVSESSLDDQLSVDKDILLNKCIGKIRERMNSSLIVREQFERVQTLLYLRDQELMLCEKMLEQEMFDRSEMMNLSNDLGKASAEVIALRNERYSLQKELERAEEKSSLLREKLSMAVKKGKGLVHEREGLKLSLEEKTLEIEKLKHDLQLQESTVVEHKEQLKSLSVDLEQTKKLELDIVSLKDQKDQIEQFLLESNSTLQRVIDCIENIGLPTDKIFKEPVEKVKGIADHIHTLEVAKAHVEQDMEKMKEEATLQASKLADAYATMKSLEDALSQAEKRFSLVADENKGLQLGNTSMEQELEKFKEEVNMQADKLAHAYATIESLEDALSQADKNISLLDAEKNEAESKGKQEILSLNAKLAKCMEELVGTHGSLENQSAELVSHLGHIQMLIKDDSLSSIVTEGFRKKIEGLRNVGLLLQNMHDHFVAKGLHTHPGLEQDPDLAKLFSLPNFEDYLNGRMVHSDTNTVDLDDAPSISKVVEGFRVQTKLLQDRFEGLSDYMDDHIALTLQALQAARNEVIHMLELTESLKLSVNKLEGHNQAQDVKLLSLQNEVMTLLSACTAATQDLQMEFRDLLDLDSNSELDMFNSSLDSLSKGAAAGGVEEGKGKAGASDYVEAADSLLLAARKVRLQSQQFANVKRVWIESIADLKSRLKQSELTIESAIQDRHLNQERVSKLEGDLEAFQKFCSELEVKIDNYQAKENLLRDKEEELLSLQHSLATKDKGVGDKLFSEGQLETLINKVNKMVIPVKESETKSQILNFSSPVDKFLYIVDKFSELQHIMDSMTHEKEDLHVILESHVHEIENLKKATETISTTSQELELKKAELTELTVGLERIIQELGGNESSEDKKPVTAKGLLPVLERLTIASSLDSQSSKSKVQELGAKLQAKEKVVDELSEKVKLLEDSLHARLSQPDTVKERTVFEASSAAMGSEISEIEDVGPPGKNLVSHIPAAAHVRTMRKGSNDHLVLNIDSESDALIAQEIDDKGHVFKSLNTSGLIPKQGKLVADRIDGIWVSAGRMLMRRPGARLSLIAYWLVLHLWLLGAIL